MCVSFRSAFLNGYVVLCRCVIHICVVNCASFVEVRLVIPIDAISSILLWFIHFFPDHSVLDISVPDYIHGSGKLKKLYLT